MLDVTRTNRHSFSAYTFENKVRLSITQFGSDEFADLYIISDMGVHMTKEEARRLIELLQEALS
jgi:hypothetical protein